MASRISPKYNHLVPIPTNVNFPLVGLKKFSGGLNDLIATDGGGEIGLKEEFMDVVPSSNRAVQVTIGNRIGGGKMKSVIPKKRKLVKTMMYHSIKNFVKSFFCPPPYVGARVGAPP